MLISSGAHGGVAARRSDRAPIHNRGASSRAASLGDRVELLPADFAVARRGTANVFLIGPDALCDRVIATLGRYLVEPVVACRAGAGLVLPPPHIVGALIVRGVDTLPEADQRRLLDWLGQAVAVKVISTATAPLLPQIERGAFLASLYYRLNTICIFVTEGKRDSGRDG